MRTPASRSNTSAASLRARPSRPTQTGDTLRVEIGPVEGSYPGMLKTRGYELRLPADWPPASVTVNGVAVQQAGPLGKAGWSFEGNTLTTIIPVPSYEHCGAR